jgi:hypothetical protein
VTVQEFRYSGEFVTSKNTKCRQFRLSLISQASVPSVHGFNYILSVHLVNNENHQKDPKAKTKERWNSKTVAISTWPRPIYPLDLMRRALV